MKETSKKKFSGLRTSRMAFSGELPWAASEGN